MEKIVLGTKTSVKGCAITIKPEWIEGSKKRKPYLVWLGETSKLITRDRRNAIMRGKPLEEFIPIATDQEMQVLAEKFPGLLGRFLMKDSEKKILEKEQAQAAKQHMEYMKQHDKVSYEAAKSKEDEEAKTVKQNSNQSASTGTTSESINA